jgi:hypothetical protein
MRTRRQPSWAWAASAALIATIPFAQGLTGSRIFYIRDLSLYFWGRYLWLRRTLWSGEWPLWDPYIGAGQAAFSDALHQMFLLPVLLVRMVGNEALGFNLWVLTAFPFAAVGAWGFFARRFSPMASSLGAITFAACGPMISTGNFPNMSWSVAAIPWALWAVDCAASRPSPRSVAAIALAVAFQAFAGEPVTLFATFLLSAGFVLMVPTVPALERIRGLAAVGIGLGLGTCLAAIQLVPMMHAATVAQRAEHIYSDLWSLHPRALPEMLVMHVFGDYFRSPSLAGVPWMPLVNSGREPFFFSLYFGVPVLALALFGLLASPERRWNLFWVLAGGTALVAAFGVYTPIYPFIRNYLPFLGSFRFPVKYLVVSALAIAAGVAAASDTVDRRRSGDQFDASLFNRARYYSAGFALLVAVGALLVANACLYAPGWTGLQFTNLARSMEAPDPAAAAQFLLRSLPRIGIVLFLVSVAAALLLFLSTSGHRAATVAGHLLRTFVVADLVVRAWAINPVIDVVHLGQPQWLATIKSEPQSRFYVGGKRDGTLDATDIDSSRAFLNPPGLTGSASRAAVSAQAAFYPSAWRMPEFLSYDLAVLWPHDFHMMLAAFQERGAEARDRFLDRTGIRYRVLPYWRGKDRERLVKIPYFLDSFLYDWGTGVTPRADVVANVRVIADFDDQLEAMFEAGWDNRTTALVDRQPAIAGAPGPPLSPGAAVIVEASNRLIVDAKVGADGGYLVLLDSYSPDWQVRVDGVPADMARANALFRAVRLSPGRHTVEFVYRPSRLLVGAAVSAVSLLLVIALAVVRGRAQRQIVAAHA